MKTTEILLFMMWCLRRSPQPTPFSVAVFTLGFLTGVDTATGLPNGKTDWSFPRDAGYSHAVLVLRRNPRDFNAA